MSQTLDEQFLHIKNSTGAEQEKLFLEYCLHLIDLKDKGYITEEQVGYRVTAVGLTVDTLSKFDTLFDMSGDLEKSRETSYRQPIGSWDEKTADALKRQEWEEFVNTVQSI